MYAKTVAGGNTIGSGIRYNAPSMNAEYKRQ